jgi:hypothetical protein
VNVIGAVPDQLPASAVIVSPIPVFPLTLGGVKFTGAAACAALVVLDGALALPAPFRAVTWTRKAEPMSAVVTV